LEQLEACCQGLPYSSTTASACAAFMQASGINYTVNTIPTYDAGAAYGRYWYKANSIQRVTINSINGQAFDEYDDYAVITHDKNFNGMDASYVFKDATTRDDQNGHWSTVTNYDCYQVVMDYIQSQLGGTIGSTYTSPASRISIS